MPLLDTRNIDVKEPLAGWRGRFFNTESMTFGYYDTVAGAAIHEHSHPNEEVWHVIEGELEVTIAGRTERAGAGCVAIVPPNTPHRIVVKTEGRVIVVDHPLRAAFGDLKK